jgi:hypothetical protein
LFEGEQPDGLEHKLEHQRHNNSSGPLEQPHDECVERRATPERKLKEEHLHRAADVEAGAGGTTEPFEQVDIDGFGGEQELEQPDRSEPGVRDEDAWVLAEERGVEGDLQQQDGRRVEDARKMRVMAI